MKLIRWITLIGTLLKLSLSNPVMLSALHISAGELDTLRNLLKEDSEYRERAEETRSIVEEFSTALTLLESRAIQICVNGICRLMKAGKRLSRSFAAKRVSRSGTSRCADTEAPSMRWFGYNYPSKHCALATQTMLSEGGVYLPAL